MVHICCIRAGTAFSPEYVNILFDSIRRNLADGFEGEFVCFTDQPDKLDDGIIVRPLPVDLPGWWSKIGLFRDGLFPAGDRILFFDLDTVVTGRLDELAGYDGPFAILRDFYRQDGLQSAVMAWTAGEATKIWEKYVEAGYPMDDPGGDQVWIERFYLHKAVRLQNAFPGMFVSYKLINGPPDKASVVVFHGLPRPHEVTGWVSEVWKVGGMTRAELDIICNTKNEELIRNVKSAIARDLAWFDGAPEHDGHVCIVGGGPSLAETLEELRWRKSIGQKVWALNGAARFLYKNGINVDAVVVVDARPGNADFLSELNQGTKAYLASQCSPSVFDAAQDCQLDTILWHFNTEETAELLKDEKDRPAYLIGGGSTVGMTALYLATTLGYRKLHLYGFDSSYRDESHHAYSQALNDNDRIIDALYNDKRFRIAPWMAQQVNDFQENVPGLIADGCVITLHGDGLLQTVAADLIGNIPQMPAQCRAGEILKRIEHIKEPRGAEIGVFAGEMSRALLIGHPGLRLFMIDSWEGSGKAYDEDSGDWHANLTQASQDAFYEAALSRTNIVKDRCVIVRKRSVEAANHVADSSLDFVFIDADHSYDGCAADIWSWLPKVKPGGFLCGHDYENTGFPKFGVTQAVNEFIAMSGLTLELGDNFCWFVQLPQQMERAA